MLSIVVLKKISSMFLTMFLGWLVTRIGIVKADDSRILSKLSLYLIYPCVSVACFSVEKSSETIRCLIFSIVSAIICYAIMITFCELLKKPIHMDSIEVASLIYTNCGNLILPIVGALYGSEWLIYTFGFTLVYRFLIWSHGKSLISGKVNFDLKELFLNINIIAIFVGLTIFILEIKLPSFFRDSLDDMVSILNPIAMLNLGIILGKEKIRNVFMQKRLWLISVLRLICIPLIVIPLMKYSCWVNLCNNGYKLLMITLLGLSAPSGASVVQLAQIYNSNVEEASAINILTTLLCIITIPLMVFIYQL